MRSRFRTVFLPTLLLPVLMALSPAVAGAAPRTIPDHADLTGPYESGPAVTAACLDCHEDAAHDFMKTSHWTWESLQGVVGKGEALVGKKNLVNNYCVAVNSNWPRCTSCHAGYGWTDAGFDFTQAGNVDCLVCHDQTGKYRKFPTGAGHPVYKPTEWEGKIWEPQDLASLARTVGQPSRANCGACHFAGGGGNNVKHGDMESALLAPARELDVHMSADGQNFNCQECHTTSSHNIAGRAMFASPGAGANHLECTACHDENVHGKRILNWHGKSIACQTCHIPAVARANPTMVWWDWSTAGTNLSAANDSLGMPTFDNKKGSFRWEKNVVPSYSWYDGVSAQYLVGDKMDPKSITHLNRPQGSRLDPRAKIYPFKVMRGKQPYDKQQNVILVPKLYGPTGFWKTNDWNAAFKEGMASVNLTYSGEYAFAETESWWKVNHMVAPKEAALKCKDCHAGEGTSRIDWAALGYKGDPSKHRGISRFELSDVYKDLNE
ncbi:MAG: tetrathionate reductase family octaheme c-type cytochrome [bacterium]|nr:tetrathionate reductase family octaheme c-type cytochrome [bacterium]